MKIPKWPFRNDEADPFQGDLWGAGPHLCEECEVLDIGANRGIFTAWCALNGAFVTAYEPHPKAFQSLQQVIQLNEIDYHVRAIQAAISTYTGATKLDMSTGPYFNSAAPSERSLRNQDPEHNIFGVQVPCVSFADAVGKTFWDVVKMDVEGAEFPILLECPDSVFDHIGFLTVELHSRDDVVGPEHGQLKKRLSQHFHLVESGTSLFASKI